MTTTETRRHARWLLVPFVALALLFGTAPLARADDDPLQNKDVNEAQAINQHDGGTIFRFSLAVRKVTDGVVNQTNTADAEASCVDCRTVAAAFQVILVSGDASVVTPQNKAVAVNYQCEECLTYAKATQIVIDTTGKELTPKGHQRLAKLESRMHEVEKHASEMTDAELLAAVRDAQAELVAIFEEELVPIENGSNATTTTSSTSTSSTSTSTPTSTTRSTVTSTTSTTSATTTTAA
jgi:putative peptide zinc metalloprotease protein